MQVDPQTSIFPLPPAGPAPIPGASVTAAHPPHATPGAVQPVHAGRRPHQAKVCDDGTPYWQYLERQNRRHDVIEDRPLRPAATGDLEPAPATPGPRTPERGRPSYAGPRLGEVLTSRPPERVVRIEERAIRPVLSPSGTLIDVMG